jgi:hypothetical protein
LTSIPSKSLPSLKSLTWTNSIIFLINTLLLCLILSIGLQSFWLMPEWQVAKRQQEMLVMGGDEFLLCRSAHSSRGLNLAAWWGHQQITLRAPPEFNKLRLQFEATPQSRIDVFFSQDLSLSVGSNQLFHRGWVNAENKLSPMTWAFLHERFNELEISQNQIKINGNLLDALPSEVVFDKLSIRGGREDIFVKKLTLFQDNQTVYSTNFHNPYLPWRLLLRSLKIMGVLICLLLLIVRFHLASLFLIQFPIMLILKIYIGWDYFFWSQHPLCSLTYNINEEIYTTRQNSFEKKRFQTLSFLAPEYSTPKNRDLLETLGYPTQQIFNGPVWCDPKCRSIEENKLRDLLNIDHKKQFIVIMGSSQSIGSGALTINDTFYAQAFRELNRPDIILINLAKSGYRSEVLFEEYQTILKSLPPSMIIHNWGNNDNEEEIRRGVTLGLQLPLHHHLMFKEANSKEYYYPGYSSDIYEAIDELASTHGSTLIEWNELINQEFQKAPVEMWWDWVHFNQLGHKKAASIFENILRKELEIMDKQLAL